MNKNRLRRRPHQIASVAQKSASISVDEGLGKSSSDVTEPSRQQSLSQPSVVSLPVH